MTADDDVHDGETRVWLWADLAPRSRYRFAVVGPYPSWQDAADATDRAPRVLDLDRKIHSAWRVDESEPTGDCEIHRIDEDDDTGEWFA